MAKKVNAKIKINIKAGKATPAPPVGSSLGQHGVATMEFVSQFNAATANMGDVIVPTIITVYDDRTFSFITKTPPTASLILKEAGIDKGSSNPKSKKVGKISRASLEKIALVKMPDLNAIDINGAINIVAGSAKSMGLEIEE